MPSRHADDANVSHGVLKTLRGGDLEPRLGRRGVRRHVIRFAALTPWAGKFPRWFRAPSRD